MICKFCNKQFEGKRGNKLTFCSVNCFKKWSNHKIQLICAICKKPFKVSPSRANRIKTCSQKCGGLFRRRMFNTYCLVCKKQLISHPSYVKKYCSKDCWGIANRNKRNYLWKGEKATYRTKHAWLVRRIGKANHCEHCGLDKLPKGKKRIFDWANISGKYKRDITDYISLCKKCHKHFDGYGG